MTRGIENGTLNAHMVERENGHATCVGNQYGRGMVM